MAVCPKCGSPNVGRCADWFDLTLYCNGCSWSSDSKSEPAKPAKRIRTSTAKVDIDNAFIAWFNAAGWSSLDAREADSRVKVWLKQVDGDQARLHKAMLACQAMDVANNDADVRQATKLAREAIEG